MAGRFRKRVDRVLDATDKRLDIRAGICDASSLGRRYICAAAKAADVVK